MSIFKEFSDAIDELHISKQWLEMYYSPEYQRFLKAKQAVEDHDKAKQFELEQHQQNQMADMETEVAIHRAKLKHEFDVRRKAMGITE